MYKLFWNLAIIEYTSITSILQPSIVHNSVAIAFHLHVNESHLKEQTLCLEAQTTTSPKTLIQLSHVLHEA